MNNFKTACNCFKGRNSKNKKILSTATQNVKTQDCRRYKIRWHEELKLKWLIFSAPTNYSVIWNVHTEIE